MKRMLVNATQPEELRLALVDGKHLYDLNIDSAASNQKKSNIYKGKLVRVETSLDAAFVDYGTKKHGFLPFREVALSLLPAAPEGEVPPAPNVAVRDALKVGQELIVQVEKEERGNKGAALTTFISLAGRYLVLTPNNPRAGGVSRQIMGEARSEARRLMNELDMPQGVGVILRTAGVGKSRDELQWDLDHLIKLWSAINNASTQRLAPFLIHRETDVISRAIRDSLREDIDEIWIDDTAAHQQALECMEQIIPDRVGMLKLHDSNIPLFNRFHIESQIEAAYARKINLPSGGAIIIDHTEALISIDVNSAKSMGGSDVEETALHTNLEAAKEVACQMRLRDLAGLIVIDFIDMAKIRNQREVENCLRDQLRLDRAMVQLGRISRFGLLEMSRQRLRPSLDEFSHISCPRCQGQGTIRGELSLALSILRILEEESIKDRIAQVIVYLPLSVATFLLNEKRGAINEIEHRHHVNIMVVPSPRLSTPAFETKSIRIDEAKLDPETALSQHLSDGNKSMAGHANGAKPRRGARYSSAYSDRQEKNLDNEPAIVIHRSPHPEATSNDDGNEKEGFFSRVLSRLSHVARSSPSLSTDGEEKPESGAIKMAAEKGHPATAPGDYRHKTGRRARSTSQEENRSRNHPARNVASNATAGRREGGNSSREGQSAKSSGRGANGGSRQRDSASRSRNPVRGNQPNRGTRRPGGGRGRASARQGTVGQKQTQPSPSQITNEDVNQSSVVQTSKLESSSGIPDLPSDERSA